MTRADARASGAAVAAAAVPLVGGREKINLHQGSAARYRRVCANRTQRERNEQKAATKIALLAPAAGG